MYSYARSLQGKCIPRLMAAGNLCCSMFAFLATSPQGMCSIPCIGFQALLRSENVPDFRDDMLLRHLRRLLPKGLGCVLVSRSRGVHAIQNRSRSRLCEEAA